MLFPTAFGFMLFPQRYYEKIEEDEHEFNLDFRGMTTKYSSSVNEEKILTNVSKSKSLKVS